MTVRQTLRQRIEAAGGFAAAAEKLDCTREHLYSLCSDEHEPRLSLKMAADIESAFGISMQEWAIVAGAA